MKALGLVVSDKKIFENCILKTYFLTLWPTYATNWNSLNNFDSGPPRDHSCEVWSKSNKWFQGRCCLKKLLMHARTMDDGQWAITKAHLEHFVLRWTKNNRLYFIYLKIFIILTKKVPHVKTCEKLLKSLLRNGYKTSCMQCLIYSTGKKTVFEPTYTYI